MKRLRHPIRAIEEPFGKAGLIVAVIALVLALTGAAFAATGLNGKQKKEVEKIAKKFAGKPGAPGANGTNGTNGAPGAKGDPGAAGSNGVSPVGTEFAGTKEGHCSEGGVEFKGATTTFACNGKKGTNGTNGKEGSPWTELGVLPPGQAEQGTWGVNQLAKETGTAGVNAPISFPIPLAAPLDEEHVQIIPEESEGTEGCEGTVSNPVAEPGYLCVYVTTQSGLETAPLFALVNPEALEGGAGRSGAILRGALVKENAYGFGVWIVRAPEGP